MQNSKFQSKPSLLTDLATLAVSLQRVNARCQEMA